MKRGKTVMIVGNRRFMGRLAVWLLVWGCLAAGLWAYALMRGQANPVTPQADAVFLSSRYITGIAVAPDGTVWAASYGGLLRRAPEGTWRRFTRGDGLPSNEVRGVALAGSRVIAATPRGNATFDSGTWHTEAVKTSNVAGGTQPSGRLCDALWHGQEFAATAVGLQVREGKLWRDVALPPSTGTHVSALLPHGDALWAALYGDGIRAYDGRGWSVAAITVPAEAREITALAEGQGALWIGTRRAGLWEYRGGRWQQSLQPDEPVSHNCQAMTAYQDKLYVSTLEDGLAVRSAAGWEQVTVPTLSSNAPRQMALFGGRLYVRHGDGKVDCLAGTEWQRDVCHGLPRKQVSAIAADGDRLYAAQWGGWSEFDGKTWTHHLQLPELQGVPVTVLFPDGARLWIGTQGRGLAEYDRSGGKLRWHDERNGMPDDWITAIARAGGNLYAGTFVGGLARQEGTTWRQAPELMGENVTALANRGADEMVVTTRHGVWTVDGRGVLAPLPARAIPLDPEAQALCVVPGGLWIGARTGLFFLAHR